MGDFSDSNPSRDPDDGFPASTQLFVHMSPMNPFDHLGESLPFSIRVFEFE